MVLDLDQSGRIPQVERVYLGPTVGYKYVDNPVDIEFVIDGAGAVPALGFRGTLISPMWLVVNNWVLLANQLGSCQLDVWKIPLADYLAGTVPTAANSICGSELPSLASQVARQSSVLAGWSTIINQNDVLGFNLNNAVGVLQLTLTLECVKIIGQT